MAEPEDGESCAMQRQAGQKRACNPEEGRDEAEDEGTDDNNAIEGYDDYSVKIKGKTVNCKELFMNNRKAFIFKKIKC